MKRYQKANEGIHVPEEVRERAFRPAGRRGRSRWTGAVAAVLAAAVLGGAALWPRPGGEPSPVSDLDPGVPAPFSVGEENNPVQGRNLSGAHYAHALSMAAHPEMAPYPREDEFTGDSGQFGDAYTAWQDSISALRAGLDWPETADGFLSASTTQFLAGAGAENRVYSPLNVYLALSMLAETAGGDSRRQLLEVLQVDSIEDLRDRAAALWAYNYRDDGLVTSMPASSLWLRDDLSYSQDTLDTLARDYHASSFAGEMGTEEYTQALRDWLNEQTGGLLAEQAEGLALEPETVLALASTLYFKAAWSDWFDASATRREVFHTPSGDVEADFMCRTLGDSYYWGEHFSAVCLRFQEGGGMWLILPDEGCTVDQLLESGEAMEFLLADKYAYDGETGELVGGWPGQKSVTINLSMPRFDVSSDLDLAGGLEALGITDVFDGGVANFEPLGADTDVPLFVSKIRHAARVQVDEEGCEGAAYTVIEMNGGGPPPDEMVDFTLDRPFLFVVDGAGLPLFTGVVNQPAG